MKKYKLTDQNLQTYRGFQWEVEKWVKVDGKGQLCSKHKLHYYHHPLLAALLHPIHVNMKNPKLWEVSAKGGHLNDKGLKGGCNKMRLDKEIPLPKITLEQRIAFAILCALFGGNPNKGWKAWAKNWLSGADRSLEATEMIADGSTTCIYALEAAQIYAGLYIYDYPAVKEERIASDVAHGVQAMNSNLSIYTNKFNLIRLAKKALKY
jgi:hypothetical protein